MAKKKLTVEIAGDTKGLGKAVGDADGHLSKLSGSLKGVATVAAGFLTGAVIQGGIAKLGSFFSESVEQSTKLGESINAVNKIFGDSAKEIHDWGKSNAVNFGLSTASFNQLATPLGALLKNQGIANVSGQTIELTKRAADLASVFNTDVEVALAAINSGLKGEADPLEQFGIGVSAAKVEAQALADTGKKLAKELTDQEKAQARLNLIMRESASVAGDFTSTAGEYANAQRISAAKTEELQAKLGTKLVPIMQKVTKIKLALVTLLVDKFIPVFEKVSAVVTMAASLIGFGFQNMDRTSDGWHGKMEEIGIVSRRVFDWIKENVPPVLRAIGEVITTKVVPALEALGSFLIDTVFPAITKVWGFLMDHKEILIGVAVAIGVGLVAAFVGWAIAAGSAAIATIAAMAPIIAIGVAIAALVAGVIYAYQHWGFFKTAVDAVAAAGQWLWEHVLQPFASWLSNNFIKTLEVVGRVILASLTGGMSEAALFIYRHWDEILAFFTGLPGRIAGAAAGMWDGIRDAFRDTLNWIIRGWNSLDFEIPGFDPPGPGPKFGGFTLGVPDIPEIHSGGTFRSPTPGGEGLAMLRDGERVSTPGGGGGDVHIHVAGSVIAGRDLVAMLREELRRGNSLD